MRVDRNQRVAGLALCFVLVCAGLGRAQTQTAPSQPSSLHVVLLQATNAPAEPSGALPPALVAAVKGATASRPFKWLRVLDQAVLRVQGQGSTRLKGPGASEYVLAASGGTLSGSTANEIGAAVHLFQTNEGVLETTAPEVLWGEFSARPGETVFVWPYDEKNAGADPLVLMATPLTRELAATLLQAPARHAADSLGALLTGECGMVVDASSAAAPSGAAPNPISPADWKTVKPRVENAVLLFERVRVTAPAAGEPASRPRAYQVTLRGLSAPEFRVSFGPRPEDPFLAFSFPCAAPGCVAVDGAPEEALRIRACTGKASELLKAVQMLVIQAGGGWGPS